MKTIKGLNFSNKRVILRVDFNVTIDAKGKIIDDIKVESTLPTIKRILKDKPKEVILISHFGRPVYRANDKLSTIISGNKGLTLKTVADDLSKRLGLNKEPKVINKNNFGLPFYQLDENLLLMENIRFDKREEENDKVLSRELANLADIYVCDAFGNAHRKHSSMVGIAEILPAYAGLLMEKEVNSLTKLLEDPEKPFVLILGGAKTSEKINTLKKLIKKANKVLLAGVTANTFLYAREVDIKKSVYEKESVDVANELYMQYPGKFHLPNDLVWRNDMAVDIGTATINEYKKIIEKGKTIFWNGTMGLTSLGNFKYSLGTREIIKAIVESDASEKIVCGGDTIAEVDKAHMSSKMSHISTGGGAALSFLAGEEMPIIDLLNKK